MKSSSFEVGFGDATATEAGGSGGDIIDDLVDCGIESFDFSTGALDKPDLVDTSLVGDGSFGLLTTDCCSIVGKLVCDLPNNLPNFESLPGFGESTILVGGVVVVAEVVVVVVVVIVWCSQSDGL